MSSDRPVLPRQWFLIAALIALIAASAGLLLMRGGADQQPSPVPIDRPKDEPGPINQEPEPEPKPKPPPPPPEPPPPPPKIDEPPPPPAPEASTSFSSGSGGPSKPNPSVVAELPPLWELLIRPWMPWAAAGALVALAFLQWRRRRSGNGNDSSQSS
ncbi:MAG: hypothetical protein Q8M07_05135 [Prosthecobacter sp.]|nr:hypothetical protein [Prosthecobacter sp.]